MKFSPSLLALLAFLTVGAASAQTPEQQPSGQTRPRTVTVIPPPSQQPVAPQPQPSQQTQTPAQPQPAIVIPPIMGVIADWWGATESFVVLAVFLLLACVPILRITRRAAATGAAPVEEAPEPT